MEQGVARLPLEADYRRRIRALVPDEELRALSRISVADTAVALASIWLATIVLLVAASFVPRLPTLWAVVVGCALVIVITTRVNALSVMIHEAVHGCLARRRRWNDLIGNACAGWWILNTVEGYRGAHNRHHRYLHTPRDPDLGSYLVPKGMVAVARRVAEDLFGITAARRAIFLDRSQRESTSRLRSFVNHLGMTTCQLILLAVFVVPNGVVVGVMCYVVFWVVPVGCLYPLLLRLKTITEHFDGVIRSHPGTVLVSRTSASGWLQDRLIGARMEYHFEHHVFPTIPYRGLQRLHRTLVQRGFFESADRNERARIESGGYIQFASSRIARHTWHRQLPLEAGVPTSERTAT
jgi:fatty acid desaturase